MNKNLEKVYPDFQSRFMPYGHTGVLYFPGCFDQSVFDENIYEKITYKNDDIWFWLQALIAHMNRNNDPIKNPIHKILPTSFYYDQNMKMLLNDEIFGDEIFEKEKEKTCCNIAKMEDGMSRLGKYFTKVIEMYPEVQEKYFNRLYRTGILHNTPFYVAKAELFDD
jgi:hypothetical protein